MKAIKANYEPLWEPSDIGAIGAGIGKHVTPYYELLAQKALKDGMSLRENAALGKSLLKIAKAIDEANLKLMKELKAAQEALRVSQCS